jgi:hypothetical protein
MRDNRRIKLVIGVVLMASFIAVLVAIFLPLFDGDNILNALDNLYNSISKGSAYYIPKVLHQVEEHGAQPSALTLDVKETDLAARVAALLENAGMTVSVAGATVTARGDLSAILRACAEDADAAYHGRGDEVEARRGMAPRVALHGWWSALGAVERDLTRQELFDAAQLVHTVKTKAVECAYHYYGLEARQISERWGIVLASLLFYVIYTVWYGYAILYIFEGLWLQLSH